MTPEQLKELIEHVRILQVFLSPFERYCFWSDLTEGYCKHCGDKRKEGEICYCTVDD